MASASIVVTPTISYATTWCGALDTNPTVHVLRRFLDNRKTTKFGCTRSHAAGHFPLPTFSVLPHVVSTIRRIFFASKSLFWVEFNTLSCLARLRSIYLFYRYIICSRIAHIISPLAPHHNPYPLVLQVGPHHEVLTFYLISTPRHLIVLGLSWLETHNPTVDWCNRSITFPVRSSPVWSLPWSCHRGTSPFGSTICPHGIMTLRTY